MSKSHWTYQIVKYKDGSGFGLHEVFYNDDEEPWGRTDDPEVLNHLGPSVDKDDPITAEGLKRNMALMLCDALLHDVLEEPEEWADPPWHDDSLDEADPPDLERDALLLDSETNDLEHDARREEEPELDAL